MFQVLGITLLLLAPLLAAPQFEDDHDLFADETEGAFTPVAQSGEEETTKRLDLEDPVSWSASTEVLDENHAWYRRRRSAEVSKVDATEDEAQDDLAAVESVVFMPARLRYRKKLAHEECRSRHQEFSAWRKQTSNHHAPIRNHCNNYCCYPITGEF